MIPGIPAHGAVGVSNPANVVDKFGGRLGAGQGQGILDVRHAVETVESKGEFFGRCLGSSQGIRAVGCVHEDPADFGDATAHIVNRVNQPDQIRHVPAIEIADPRVACNQTHRLEFYRRRRNDAREGPGSRIGDRDKRPVSA